MEIPVIDLSELKGEKRSQTMALLDQACEKWGCFQVKIIFHCLILFLIICNLNTKYIYAVKSMQIKNHGVYAELMDKVKQLVNTHYEQNLKQRYYESDIAKGLECKDGQTSSNVDWESSFFICHRPKSNMETIENLPKDFW